MTRKITLLALAINFTLISCTSYKKLLIQNQNATSEIIKRSASLEQDKVTIDTKLSTQQKLVFDLNDDLIRANNISDSLDREILKLKDATDVELVAVSKIFIHYLKVIADICKNPLTKPDCNNAANGHFVNFIVKDAESISLEIVKNLKSKDAKKLMDIYTYFASNNQRTFIENPNTEDKKAGFKMLEDAFRLYNIYNLLGEDIARLYLTEGADLSAWKKTKADFDSGIEELKHNKNVCRRGSHANGWIADWNHTTAQTSLDLLNKTTFFSGTKKADGIYTVLHLFFTSLAKMQTNTECKDCTFLPPQWQLGYGLILQTTADKLTDIINK